MYRQTSYVCAPPLQFHLPLYNDRMIFKVCVPPLQLYLPPCKDRHPTSVSLHYNSTFPRAKTDILRLCPSITTLPSPVQRQTSHVCVPPLQLYLPPCKDRHPTSVSLHYNSIFLRVRTDVLCQCLSNTILPSSVLRQTPHVCVPPL